LQENDWWETLSLFLWFYYAVASGVVFLYLYGICRLAERNFEGRTYAYLLLPFFVLMIVGTLIFYTAKEISPFRIWIVISSWLGCLFLLIVVYRAYRVMMG
jgi:hypothetical protein